jgi:hypothetical protein
MDFGEHYFSKLSFKSGFDKLAIEKSFRVLDLIKDLILEEDISEDLIITSCTAFNMVNKKFQHLPISLNVVIKQDSDKFGSSREKFEKALKYQGYKIKKVSDNYYELGYRTVRRNRAIIDLHFCLTSISEAFGVEKSTFVNPFTKESMDIWNTSLEESIARILIRLEERYDLEAYLDLCNLKEILPELNIELVQNIYLLLSKNYSFLKNLSAIIIKEDDMDKQIWPIQQKKHHLAPSDLRAKAEGFLDVFAQLSEKQEYYLTDPREENLTSLFSAEILAQMK